MIVYPHFFIYIRLLASSSDEEEYQYKPVFIENQDNVYYYGHYLSNNLQFRIKKDDVYQLNGNLYANKYECKPWYSKIRRGY